MKLSEENINSMDKLKGLALKYDSLLFVGSKTSTVIPYEHLDTYFDESTHLGLINYQGLPELIEVDTTNLEVKIRGAVTWEKLRSTLKESNLDLLISPTETEACVLASISTSATGERSFRFGTLRDQVVSLEVFNFSTNEFERYNQEESISNELVSKAYQEYYIKNYFGFKNAPMPRLEKSCDPFIGTEGQLGFLSEVKLKVRKKTNNTYVLVGLNKWTDSSDHTVSFLKFSRKIRELSYICEFIDNSSLKFLSFDRAGLKELDLGILEVEEDKLELVLEKMSEETFYHEDRVFLISKSDFDEVRLDLPRNIAEYNSKNKLQKIGTDIQVIESDFLWLLQEYKILKEKYPNSLLFGHLGDCHLHFNFIEELEKRPEILSELKTLYKKVQARFGSPFAEHGIGLLKQDFVFEFLTDDVKNTLIKLKNTYDPGNKLFSKGLFGRLLESKNI